MKSNRMNLKLVHRWPQLQKRNQVLCVTSHTLLRPSCCSSSTGTLKVLRPTSKRLDDNGQTTKKQQRKPANIVGGGGGSAVAEENSSAYNRRLNNKMTAGETFRAGYLWHFAVLLLLIVMMPESTLAAGHTNKGEIIL